ncbi:MAG: CRTAC1 family protein [Sandaracinus sp.]|nr:CRTAC1 family protein [Sandaracinus sp.]MCB9619284.1 CRTAC1 family protein [Sandaracinus sp.]MCB9631398.1 CRTAC1 family protein [Sandaracinus sp.]
MREATRDGIDAVTRTFLVALLLGACGSPGAAPDASVGSDASLRVVDAGRDAFVVASGPHFTRVDVGLRWHQWNDTYPPPCYLAQRDACLARLFTGGLAVRDVDLDGDLDVYATRMDETDRLFVNDGTGRFSEATPPGLGEVWLSNAAAFADVDEDGDPDLLVGTVGEERLHFFVNDGRGSFEERAVGRGIAMADELGSHSTMSLCFGDLDLDGYLDAHATEWRTPAFPRETSHNRLFTNRGRRAPGFFDDVTDLADVELDLRVRAGAYGFTSHLVDVDADLRPELVIAADFGTSRIFWNDGVFPLVDGTTEAGLGSDQNGMGSVLEDLDGDGDLDWFVGSIFAPVFCDEDRCTELKTGNRLFRNEGERRFVDATEESGARDAGWAWGIAPLDFDLDGDVDLAVVGGVQWEREEFDFDAQPIRLFENDGHARFTEVAAELGLTGGVQGRGLVAADFDGDGDQDLLVSTSLGESIYWRNDASEGRAWLVVEPEGTTSNRDGFGAVVRVWTTLDDAPQIRHHGNGCHYLAHSPGTPHFGLGDAESVARVEVTWPVSGRVQVFENVTTRQVLHVVEPGD